MRRCVLPILLGALLIVIVEADWVQVPVIDRDISDRRPLKTHASDEPKVQQAPQENRPSKFNPPSTTEKTPDKLDSQNINTNNADSELKSPPTKKDDDAIQAEEETIGLPLRELKEAHRVLLEQSTAPVSGKLQFLSRLRDKLLIHIASLVPITSRSFLGDPREARGHKGVGFPSHEGTLMSLCFLVFAVFLVKVVKHLIQAIQYNQFGGNGAGVRIAQMPDGLLPGSVMGTMMNMMPGVMPAMMPGMMPPMPMMPASAPASRTQRSIPTAHEDHHFHPEVERLIAIMRETEQHHH